MHTRLHARYGRVLASFATLALLSTTVLVAAQPASATYSGADGSIVFARQIDSGVTSINNIWKVDPQTLVETQLTTSGSDRTPDWCPGGERIVYASNTNSASLSAISIMDADGGNNTHLTPVGRSGISPSCSVTGDTVAYAGAGDVGGDYDILKVDVASSVVSVIVEGPGNDEFPAYSPDGTHLAWARSVLSVDPITGALNSSTKLMLADADGGNEVVLKEFQSTNSSQVVSSRGVEWHSDSSKILWHAIYSGGTHFDDYNLQGDIVKSRTLGALSIVPSPVGSRTAISTRLFQTPAWGIYLGDIHGNAITKITNLNNDTTVLDYEQSWQAPPDTVKPTVTIASPASGNIEQGANVTANYSCADESKLASCVGTVPNGSSVNTADLGVVTFTVTGTDWKGNETTETVNYTVVAPPPPPDTINPTVSIVSPTSSAEYAQGQAVLADYSCDDNVGVVSCVGNVPDGIAIDTATPGGKTFEVRVEDAAGNFGVESISYSVIAPPPTDNVAPTVMVNSPGTNLLLLGSSVTADFSCSDNVAIASCVGTVANGAALDTSTVGTKSFTILATDTSGNETSRVVNYQVHWPFSGFTGPVNGPPTLNTGKAGGVVPVKFSLGGDRGLAILASGYPKSVAITCAGSGIADALEEYASTPGSNTLSYDPATQMYGYNWKTDKSWSKTCRQLIVKLSDGATATANFQFK